LLRLRRLNGDATMASSLRHDTFYRRLIEPVAVAALNTPLDVASVRLFGSVMAETLFRGGRACIPAVPREGLSESLVDPAVAWLRERGCELICGRRVAGLRYGNDRVIGLETTDGPMPIEAAVLAVPPWAAGDLVPNLAGPNEFQAILNIHFRIGVDRELPGFIGIVGGTAEWVFVKRDHVSVTISAANRMVDQDAEAIASAVWPDVRTALRLEGRMPRWRVVKERRATFAATAAQERLRPGPRTDLANLVLAGDWTATGLPATIEGAIRSGRAAAEVLLAT
jgi:hypothetical protein